MPLKLILLNDVESMPTETTEAALEAFTERCLTADVSTPTSSDGKVQEAPATYQAGKGFGCLGSTLIAHAVTGRIKV